MKKFGGDKVALFLVCMSVLGNKASATNTKKAQNPQIVATEGVVNDKNSNKGLINWVKNHKRQLGVGSTLTVATAVAFTILGVKYLGKKNKDNNNIDEISNNIKGDKTTNVLDVDNKLTEDLKKYYESEGHRLSNDFYN